MSISLTGFRGGGRLPAYRADALRSDLRKVQESIESKMEFLGRGAGFEIYERILV